MTAPTIGQCPSCGENLRVSFPALVALADGEARRCGHCGAGFGLEPTNPEGLSSGGPDDLEIVKREIE